MKSRKEIKNLIKYNIEQLNSNFDEFAGSEENINIDLLITHHFNKNKVYEKYFENFDEWNSYVTCWHYDIVEINEMLLEMLEGKFQFTEYVKSMGWGK